MKVTVALAIAAVLALPQSAAASNEDWIRVPSLTGLTVDEAAAAS